MMRAIVGGLAFLTAVQVTGLAWGQCQSDTDCKGSRICQQGECLDPAPTCGTDMDCPGTEVCEAGVCAKPGSASAETEPLPPPSPSAGQSAAPTPEDPPAQPAPAAPAQAQSTPTPPPVESRIERRPITGLIIAGPIAFGFAYLTGISVTAALDADADLIGFAAVPVFGPWIMLADERTVDYSGALAVNGLVQAAGVTMFIVGLTVKREHVVPIHQSQDGARSVGLNPVQLPGGMALSLQGRF